MRGVAENVSNAFKSLASSWLRTALTTLGVQKDVTEQIQSLGANIVFVVPGKLDKNSTPNTLALLGVSTLTQRDVQALRELKSIDRVAPFIFVGGVVDQDSKLARRVCTQDDEVDALNREIIADLVEKMQRRPDLIEPTMHLFSASRHVERVADHATNIAEDVVYLVEGEIIRHRREI